MEWSVAHIHTHTQLAITQTNNDNDDDLDGMCFATDCFCHYSLLAVAENFSHQFYSVAHHSERLHEGFSKLRLKRHCHLHHIFPGDILVCQTKEIYIYAVLGCIIGRNRAFFLFVCFFFSTMTSSYFFLSSPSKRNIFEWFAQGEAAYRII